MKERKIIPFKPKGSREKPQSTRKPIPFEKANIIMGRLQTESNGFRKRVMQQLGLPEETTPEQLAQQIHKENGSIDFDLLGRLDSLDSDPLDQ